VTSGEYEILVTRDVAEFIDRLDEKSERIVRENLRKLEHPHPDQARGDKERIRWRGDEVYRLHIGRTWTTFYDIDESDTEVKVLDIMDIDQAHKRYGDLD